MARVDHALSPRKARPLDDAARSAILESGTNRGPRQPASAVLATEKVVLGRHVRDQRLGVPSTGGLRPRLAFAVPCGGPTGLGTAHGVRQPSARYDSLPGMN
jgi:hypothetical protein